MTAVLSNFISDAGKLVDQSGLLDAINRVISAHVVALSEFAKANASTRIVVVPPLPRSVPDWFSDYLPGLTALLISQVLNLSTSQIKCLSPFIAPRCYFESDGIHLNSAAGIEFIKYIFAGVDQSFPVLDCSRLASPPSRSLPPQASSSVAQPETVGELVVAVRELTSVTEKFQADVLTRRDQDNLVFARLKEDRDYELNKARENRFTVSGLRLRGDQVPPRDSVLRKDFFRDLLQKLVDEACPDVTPKPEVKDVYVNMRHGMGTPFIEGRMDSVLSSTAFLQSAIEILRALSTALTSDSQDVFVKGFSSRPALCVKAKSPEVPPGIEAPPSDPGRNYTFL